MFGFIRKLFGKNDTESPVPSENPTALEETVNTGKLPVKVPFVGNGDLVRSGAMLRLNIMTVADCHGNLMEREVTEKWEEADGKIDAVFLLGDNTIDDIECVLSRVPKNIPVFGIVGNHDQQDIFEANPNWEVTNVHKKVVEGDFKIGGYGGCIKYKDGGTYYMLHTNEESIRELGQMPYVDILITHDKPCFSEPETLNSRSGLTGIASYIYEVKPKAVIHGHLHDRSIKRLGDTYIRCCYKVEVFSVDL